MELFPPSPSCRAVAVPPPPLGFPDLATTRPHEAAARDALLARYERRLASAVSFGRPLTRPEKRALSLLSALRHALE